MADVQIGYAISSEEHLPNDIVRHARLAEEAGFTYALISDHFHPWVDAQGHSPFVWSVIGGDDAGPLLPRRRHRRGSERAHHRRSLARDAGAPGDAGGSRRGDAPPLAG